MSDDSRADTLLSAIALRTCEWSERWVPDAFAFAMLAVAIVLGRL